MFRKFNAAMFAVFMCLSALFFWIMMGSTNDGQVLGYLFLGAMCAGVGVCYLGGE